MNVLQSIDVVRTPDSSPNCFYIRTHEQAMSFFMFEQDLQTFYRQWKSEEDGDKKTILVFTNSNIFVVEHEGFFRRAKFLGLGDNGLVEAYLIDYARNCTVTTSCCYGITEEFLVNAFAIRCHLNMFKDYKDDDFSPEALEYFRNELAHVKNAVLQNNEAPFLSLSVDLSWPVLICDGPFSKEDKSETYLSQKLFKFLASSVDTTSESFNIDLEEENLAFDSGDDGLDEDEIVTEWIPSIIPQQPIGDYTRVRVTYIDGYAQIYYHLASEKAELRQIRSLLTNTYTGTVASEDTYWPTNSACVCKWSDDQWYRGTVKEKRDDGEDSYYVMLVDYGQVDIIKAEDLRKARDFGDKPALARRIVINDILPPQGSELPNDWTKSQINRLRDNLYYFTYNGNLISNEPRMIYIFYGFRTRCQD